MNLKVLMAALLAPLFPVLFFIALSMLTNANKSGLDVLIFVAVFSVYAGFFIFGLPSILILRCKNRLAIKNLAICGIALGVLVYGIFLWLFSLVMGVNLPLDFIRVLWVGAFFGAGIAIIYGVIVGIAFW